MEQVAMYSVPSGAAMQLLSGMVTELSNRNIPVLIAAGNHDSGERLSCFQELFRGTILSKGGYVLWTRNRLDIFSRPYGKKTV